MLNVCFNKESVYVGYSLDKLLKVREALEKEGIKYSYKVKNHSGQWMARGTRREDLEALG